MPVFHSKELVHFETRDLDPVVFIPPRDGADNPNLLDEEEAELEQSLRVLGDRRPDSNHRRLSIKILYPMCDNQ